MKISINHPLDNNLKSEAFSIRRSRSGRFRYSKCSQRHHLMVSHSGQLIPQAKRIVTGYCLSDKTASSVLDDRAAFSAGIKFADMVCDNREGNRL